MQEFSHPVQVSYDLAYINQTVPTELHPISIEIKKNLGLIILIW
jgi:hypothetical protein